MHKKKFVIPGIATAMVAIALVVGVILQTQAPVSAAELTQRSLGTVTSLPSDELKKLNTRINGDAQKELQAAKKAKDLKVLTYEEYKKQAAHAPGVAGGPSGGPGELPGGGHVGGPDMTKLHYLVYTDADGVHHVIGVDDKNLPVLVMAYRNGPDGSEQGSVMVVDDNGTQSMSAGGTGVGGTASDEADKTGTTQCIQVAGSDKPVCTTTNGTAPTCTHDLDGSTKCMTSAGGNSQQQ